MNIFSDLEGNQIEGRDGDIDPGRLIYAVAPPWAQRVIPNQEQ